MSEVEDLVLHLINTPLSSISFEDKCDLKDKRPTPHLNIVHKEKNQIRTFQFHWYKEYPWLTGSLTNLKLYCYVCILFGGDSEWSEQGLGILKNFQRKARKHQISRKHISNSERFQLLGKCSNRALSESAGLSALKHNEMVAHNRRLIGRLIQVVCCLGKQELAFRVDDDIDEGNYVEMLELLAQEEQFIRENLESTSGFSATSSYIQDDLIACVTQVVYEEIRKELETCEFVSVQVDETLDVSCLPQVSVTFRYCVSSSIRERFVGFYDVPLDKKPSDVSAVILNVLREWGVDKKLVCQTYDGALVMVGSPGGVQNIIKQECPLAIFIHSYAHKLNLVLLHGSKTIKQVRLFLYDLAAFHAYFCKSSKRTQILTADCSKLLQSPITNWNFQSRATSTIESHFNELKAVLVQVVDNAEDWDAESVNGASALLKILDNPEFLFLLCLYNKIFYLTESINNLLEINCRSNVIFCNNDIKQAISNLKDLRCEYTVNECINNARTLNTDVASQEFLLPAFEMLTYEIIDNVVIQMEIRFGDFETFDFVELLDEKQFAAYDNIFPTMKMMQLLNMYSFFESEQLKNELMNVYADENKHLPLEMLLRYFLDNGLGNIYEQTIRLIRLILTFPVTSLSEKNSSLNRIKTFLRNSMSNTRLSNLGTLAIEKSLLSELSRTQSFRNRVTDVFADRKRCCMELVYKNV